METKTTGELYGPAMEAKTQEEADQITEQLVQYHLEKTGLTKSECLDIVKSNLGYYAGYYSHETRERVERLFRCVHPVLGKASYGQLTPEEILKIGIACGQSGKTKLFEQPVDG